MDKKQDPKINLSYDYNKNIYKIYCGHSNINFIDGVYIGQVMLQYTSMVIEKLSICFYGFIDLRCSGDPIVYLSLLLLSG